MLCYVAGIRGFKRMQCINRSSSYIIFLNGFATLENKNDQGRGEKVRIPQKILISSKSHSHGIHQRPDTFNAADCRAAALLKI